MAHVRTSPFYPQLNGKIEQRANAFPNGSHQRAKAGATFFHACLATGANLTAPPLSLDVPAGSAAEGGPESAGP